MKRRTFRPATAPRAALLAALALTTAPSLGAQCDDCTFPGETWEFVRRSELGEHGWDAGVLARATAFLRDSANSTGVVVAHKGRIVFSFGKPRSIT